MGHRILLGVTLAGLLWQTTASAASPFGAFLRSALLPGWAQAGSGHQKAALRFAVTEALLWSGYAGLSAVAKVRRDNYRTFAVEHAGATPQGKPGFYFDDLGFYMSQQQHDLFALVDEGPEAVLYGSAPGNTWEWDLDASRQRYRDLRNAAEGAERNALFVTGLVVVNHLVAAIHAARTAGDAPVRETAAIWSLEPLAATDGTRGLSFVHRF